MAAAYQSADESMVAIRFANPKGIDFPYLLNMIRARGPDVTIRTFPTRPSRASHDLNLSAVAALSMRIKGRIGSFFSKPTLSD